MAPGKRLYSVMGVETTATPSEIKKAYHKKALLCHPDKVGESGTEQFKELQQSYAILSDPAKRKLYDLTGDNGLEAIDNGGLGAATAHPLFMFFIATVLWVVTFMLLLFSIFLVLKVDGSRSDWNWATVFSPIWVMQSFLACTLCSLLSSVAHNPEPQTFLHIVVVLLHIASPICIVLGLEGRMTAMEALTPMIATNAVQFIGSLGKLRFQSFVEQRVAAGDPETYSVQSGRYLFYVVHTFLYYLLQVLFVILVGLKLDDTIQVSFSNVFILLWILLGMSLIEYFVSAFNNAKAQDAQGSMSTLCVAGCIAIPTYGLVIAFVAMVLAKLEHPSSISLAVAFIPLFIVLGILTLAMCCFCCVAVTMPSQQQGGNEAYQPMQEEGSTDPTNTEPQYGSTA